MLVATICVPYVFLFLEALAKSLFRNRRGPVFTDLITVKSIDLIDLTKKKTRIFCSLDICSREYSYIWRLFTRISCFTKL
jgi:hypothetical protein